MHSCRNREKSRKYIGVGERGWIKKYTREGKRVTSILKKNIYWKKRRKGQWQKEEQEMSNNRKAVPFFLVKEIK